MTLFGLSKRCSFVFISTLRDRNITCLRCLLFLRNKSFDGKVVCGQILLLNSCSLLVHKQLISTNPQFKMAECKSKLKPQYFDYFLVLDFEATCKENDKIVPQEIIEFPVLKINAKTLETEAIFHQYVQPRVHSQLTPFCTKLTGIIQSMVDDQPHIEEVLQKFHQWMEENKLLDPNVKSVFVTCGDWDLMKMLPSQAGYFKLNTAEYFNKWLNIKKAYAEVTSTYPKGMMPMLEGLNISHQGRHHSGIDDCKNIGNILIELLKRGYVAKETGSR